MEHGFMEYFVCVKIGLNGIFIDRRCFRWEKSPLVGFDFLMGVVY